jgi:plasmid maintenance system antidote protein VapI
MKKDGLSNCKIANIFGVSDDAISTIVNNKSWKHIDRDNI